MNLSILTVEFFCAETIFFFDYYYFCRSIKATMKQLLLATTCLLLIVAYAAAIPSLSRDKIDACRARCSAIANNGLAAMMSKVQLSQRNLLL